MRKILSKEELEIREKRRNRIITFIILGILLVSSLGFAFMYASESGQQQTQNQNGIVQNVGDRYVAMWGGQQFNFATSPDSAINATSLNYKKDLSEYSGKPLYIDSNSDVIYSEIGLNLNKYADRVQYGCYQNCENSTWPQKNCSIDNMIVYIKADENSVLSQDKCIIIKGDIRGVDAFLYKQIGID